MKQLPNSLMDKGYSLLFVMDDKKTFLIGMNFNSETRNIEKYIIEE